MFLSPGVRGERFMMLSLWQRRWQTGYGGKNQGHFLSTHCFPPSSYSCLEIHICWKVPWQTEEMRLVCIRQGKMGLESTHITKAVKQKWMCEPEYSSHVFCLHLSNCKKYGDKVKHYTLQKAVFPYWNQKSIYVIESVWETTVKEFCFVFKQL